ncbi:TIGR03617 family F420-dependent LLM class oxidoreductase [Nocardia miyunensis]|uniref:TIGR03617 family F420-dependent LLM class oxidoreductase n=1 Tax=Nocardia miyunensis TaxID=282684 RepID=UPI000A06458C|nr:TIGR03617 family F420-dependent LLM class oxidoreductase [Nocardia miyunensis]
MKIDTSLPITASLDPRDAAARAEREGFDGVWASEINHDPFLALGLAATATDRITLGTAIALSFARNPMSTAVLANDLQVLSGGRLLLGLGTQVRAHITRRFGMPWSHPAARLREFVLAMRAIWSCWYDGVPLDFRGQFFTHTLMTPMFTPEPHPSGPPRVLLAGVGELMTEVAGEVADGFLCHGFTTEAYLREVTLPALARGRQHAGAGMGGFDIVGAPFLVVGRTESELATAAAAVRGQIAFYGSTPAYRAVLDRHGWGALGEELHALSRANRWAEMAGLIDDEVLDAFVWAGSGSFLSCGAEVAGAGVCAGVAGAVGGEEWLDACRGGG